MEDLVKVKEAMEVLNGFVKRYDEILEDYPGNESIMTIQGRYADALYEMNRHYSVNKQIAEEKAR